MIVCFCPKFELKFIPEVEALSIIDTPEPQSWLVDSCYALYIATLPILANGWHDQVLRVIVGTIASCEWTA